MDVALVRHHDLDRPGDDSVSGHAADAQIETVDAERTDVLGHLLLAGARVDQRCEQHVARGARDAVDVGDARHDAPAERRAMRAAIVPAPNPSSMFTQATPAAHDESIASSAVTPSSEAP